MNSELDLKAMLPVIEEVLSSGGEFTFVPNGRSMLPMLHGGRDSVTVIRPSGRLKKNALPLYRRKNGAFVMHRVIKVLPDGYVMRGDAQFSSERIEDSQIIAVMKSFTRNGKKYRENSLFYRLYCLIWRFYPAKRFLLHFILRKV